MTIYTPHTSDIMHILNDVTDFGDAVEQGVFGDLDMATVEAILEEAGKFAAGIVAPLNQIGDVQGAKLEDGKVILPDGWAEAYSQWAQAGWNGLYMPEEIGGQGLPLTINVAIQDMMNAASMAFAICSTLTQGAADALQKHGSDMLKYRFLPKMVSGEWTGTMNLTEPQAGSDLALLRTRAERQGDDSYKITGTKIFITYGDHELTENIIHLVLARLPDAPEGTRGMSLFAVPKYLVNEDGTLGARNDVKCLKLEEKMGIHASVTAVMAYGEEGGAIGYLVGEENRGLNCMFTMMNQARLLVGVQGIGVAERATQQAFAYAQDRKQGNRSGSKETVAIIEHPDIRRMLFTMKSLTSAARAICLATGFAIDLAEKSPDEEIRAKNANLVALLTPIAKAFSTDVGVEVASLGIQVHGGMGFIEETGAAQHYRDARIAPIYEGTNGIQAIDLVSRKLPMEGGAVMGDFIAELRATAQQVMDINDPRFGRMGYRLNGAVDALEEATDWLLQNMGDEPDLALAGATPYLRLFGLTTGGAFLARGALKALKAQEDDEGSKTPRIALARFFAENQLPQAHGLSSIIRGGGGFMDFDANDIAVV